MSSEPGVSQKKAVLHTLAHLDLVLDVFRPGGEPRDLVVVPDLLPVVALWRLRHLRVLGAVDGHVLGVDPLLEHPLLGVLTAATEQARRLDPEVADLLLVTVDQAEPVPRRNSKRGLNRRFKY